jgi:hypothetical protein
MILSAVALLEHTPKPTEKQIAPWTGTSAAAAPTSDRSGTLRGLSAGASMKVASDPELRQHEKPAPVSL